MHFGYSFDRFREVLERGLTEREVKRVVLEWHSRSIPLAKVDLESCSRRVPAGDLYKGFTDVEAGNLILSQFCKLNTEVSWPGSDLQNLAMGRDFFNHLFCHQFMTV